MLFKCERCSTPTPSALRVRHWFKGSGKIGNKPFNACPACSHKIDAEIKARRGITPALAAEPTTIQAVPPSRKGIAR